MHYFEIATYHALRHMDALITLYPFVLFLCLFCVCWLAWIFFRGKKWTSSSGIHVAASLAWLPIIALVGYAIIWLVLPVISDCIMPQVSAVAYRAEFAHGQIYGPLNAAEQYSMLYGPVTYLAQMPAFFAFGGTLFASKLTGVLALLASLWFIYRSCRALTTASESVVAVGMASLVLAYFQFDSFWNRPEPFLLLCVSVPVWMLATGRERWAFLVTGIAAAIATDLKISAVLYLFPAIALLLYRAKLQRVLVGFLAAAVVVVLPFLLSCVSLSNYLAILKVDAKHGIILQGLVECFQWAALLFVLFFAWILWYYRTGSKLPLRGILFFASLILAIGAVAVIGAKPGSGAHSLIPFMGVLPFSYFWLRKNASESTHSGGVPVFAPLALTLLLLAGIQLERVVRQLPSESRDGQAVTAELHSILRDYPKQSIEMGYGDNVYEPATYYRVLLVFAGNPYTLDATPVQELQFGGKELPAKSKYLFDECRTDIWLIPKGEQPFATRNGYNMNVQVFDSSFRTAFTTHYRQIDSRRFFDIWRCSDRRYN